MAARGASPARVPAGEDGRAAARPGWRPLAAALGLAAALFLLSLWADYAFAVQRLQRAADRGAKDGARATASMRAVPEEARRAMIGIGLDPGAAAAARIEWPPRTGAYAGRRDAVRVRIAVMWRPVIAPGLIRRRIEVGAAALLVPPEVSGANRPLTVRVE